MAQVASTPQLLAVLVLLKMVCVFAVHPRIGISGATTVPAGIMTQQPRTEGPTLPSEFEIHHYTQTLDHFNYRPESYAAFRQRYILNSKYWGGANASSPIFVWLGTWGTIKYQALDYGFIIDLAARFKGLLLYIEHRYYGESLPFGSEERALKNAGTLGYLSSQQVLADYAQVIVDVRKKLSAEKSPVIAIGGGLYGGNYASWFRLKYPHIVVGALSSSAPMFFTNDETPADAYYDVVSNDFKETSESCYNTIKESWYKMDRVAAEPDGLAALGKALNTCMPLNSTKEVKATLSDLYWAVAEYDNPPDYYVKGICDSIDGAPEGTDVLGRIVAGYNAPIFGEPTCMYAYDPEGPFKGPWWWQACTEFVMPGGGPLNNDTMFQASPSDMLKYTNRCNKLFGVAPKPHSIQVQFGGHEIKSALRNFGSNIIFSNGLRDPYSAAGVLEDISDSIVALNTKEGAAMADLQTPNSTDPAWLVALREKEKQFIAYWLAEYYTKQA